MSTTVEALNGTLESPKSSKKRKHASDSKASSKKKQKQEPIDTVKDSDDTRTLPDRVESKKKRRTKKISPEVLSSHGSPAVVVPETQEDIDLPDAPNLNGAEAEDENEEAGSPLEGRLESKEPTSFHSIRISLYLPIPPISLSSASPSILSQHLAPLLLTYYPPVGGIILSFSDPILSARPESGLNLPLKPPRKGKIPKSPPDETFSLVGDEFGSCWVWLTATFLVFRPEPGNKLSGWTNVTSEGFVGLVSYNYFQTAVGKSRIPKDWTWNGPVREKGRGRKKARKGKLNDSQDRDDEEQEQELEEAPVQENEADDNTAGSFLNANGQQVPEVLTFRVLDIEMVPAHERNKWSLQIDGSLLDEEEERAVREEERKKFKNIQQRSRSRSRTPGTPLMSGGLAPGSRAISVASSD